MIRNVDLVLRKMLGPILVSGCGVLWFTRVENMIATRYQAVFDGIVVVIEHLLPAIHESDTIVVCVMLFGIAGYSIISTRRNERGHEFQRN